MKRVLSIIFGLVLVGCLTGCQSTKAETPVVEAPVVEPHVHPATLRLELKGLSTSGTVEIGLGEKLEFDIVDKDSAVLAFYPGMTEKTWGCGYNNNNELFKKIGIEYYVYDDNNEILKVSVYLHKHNENLAKWYKENQWRNGVFYEEGNKLVTYVFLRIKGPKDPNYDQYEEQKKEQAYFKYLYDTVYGN